MSREFWAEKPLLISSPALEQLADLAMQLSTKRFPADFFSLTNPVDNIVSNPPFSPIERFVEHALTLAWHKVVILARLAFLEGVKRRDGFFRTAPLARVWVSSRRASMPPGGRDIRRGGSIPFAWFVFEHGHVRSWRGGWL